MTGIVISAIVCYWKFNNTRLSNFFNYFNFEENIVSFNLTFKRKIETAQI